MSSLFQSIPKVFDRVQIKVQGGPGHAVALKEVLGGTGSVCACVVSLKDKFSVGLEKCHNIRTKDLVEIMLRIDAIPSTRIKPTEEDRSQDSVEDNATRQHHVLSTPSVVYHHTVISITPSPPQTLFSMTQSSAPRLVHPRCCQSHSHQHHA